MNARLGVGLDYFVSDNVSIGALLSGAAYFMTRPGVSTTDLLQPERIETLGEARARLLEADGSSAGLSFALAIGPAVHF